MRLLPDWKRLIREAWSIRIMAVAMLLTGCEAVVNMVGLDWLHLPRWVAALIIFFVIGGAFVARLVAQQAVADDEHRH